MKHLGLAVLAVTVATAITAACFSDPTSSLRDGPSYIELSRNAVTLSTGDSVSIQALVKDAQGNIYDAVGMEWTSDNPSVAVASVDSSKVIPFNEYSKVFLVAKAAAGGVAHITATFKGLTASVRVLNLPAGLTALATPAVTGTARADTLPTATTPLVFSAGDTVTITTTVGSNLTFNATSSEVHFNADKAYIVSRTTTAIKVLARVKPYAGRPIVTKLTWAGPAEVGSIAIDSLQSDSIVVSRPRYRGTITQLGDTMFVAAQAGSKFSANSAVRFGATTAVMLAQDSVSLKVISPVAWTGLVTVTRVVVGLATVDSLKTPGAYTIAQASFGGTVTPTTGNYIDPIKVLGTAITKLDTGAVVTIGGAAAWITQKFPTTGSTTKLDSVYVVSRMPSSAPVTISRVNVGGTIIPQLATAGNVVVNETPTGELNEPANDAPGAITFSLTGATASNPVVIFGAVDDAVDTDDFFAFTLAATRTVRMQLQFAGNGNDGTADNPDLDLLVCNAACSAWVNTSGATGAQPENATLTNQAAGTYNIYVNGYSTGGTTRAYKLIVY